MANATENKAVVPIFSASKALDILAGKRVTFSRLEIETCEAHGDFNKNTGVFTVKTTGAYLVQFNGVTGNKGSCEVLLRVNEETKANSFCYHAAKTHHLFGSVVISIVLKLQSGDQVDVFVKNGNLVESTGAYNRFSAILLLSY